MLEALRARSQSETGAGQTMGRAWDRLGGILGRIQERQEAGREREHEVGLEDKRITAQMGLTAFKERAGDARLDKEIKADYARAKYIADKNLEAAQVRATGGKKANIDKFQAYMQAYKEITETDYPDYWPDYEWRQENAEKLLTEFRTNLIKAISIINVQGEPEELAIWVDSMVDYFEEKVTGGIPGGGGDQIIDLSSQKEKTHAEQLEEERIAREKEAQIWALIRRHKTPKVKKELTDEEARKIQESLQGY
jgi:hypothetical protein